MLARAIIQARQRLLSIGVLCAVVPLSVNAQTGANQTGAIDIESAITAAIERAEQSVVAIARGRRPQPNTELVDTSLMDTSLIPKEFGTGVIVDARGLILTNYHLLGNVEDSAYAVWHNKRLYYPALVKAADPWTDLAVLEIDGEGLPPIEFGDGEKLRKGQLVISLGNPYGIARDGSVSASSGIISNLSRKIASNDGRDNGDSNTLYRHGGLIQTDARLRLGSSGGPLIDSKGKMVGLVTSTKALAGYDSQASYALPINAQLIHVIDELKAGREPKFGFIGIEPESLSLSEQTGGAIGIRVRKVFQGTPAFAAGILADDILTQINGRDIHGIDDLLFHVGAARTDTVAQITLTRTDPILRRKRKLEREVTLSKRFVAGRRPVISSIDRFQWRGMTVGYYSAAASRSELLEFAPEGCVRVTSVEVDSPCARAGLRQGDLITTAGNTTVTTPLDFESIVAAETGSVELVIFGRQQPLIVESTTD
jgi:serine protease Do